VQLRRRHRVPARTPGEKIKKELTIASNQKDLAFQVTGLTSNMDDKITYSFG
jgi:hypothetical protein